MFKRNTIIKMLNKVKEILSKYYTDKDINKIISGYRVNRYTTIRINNIKSNREEIIKVLDKENIKYQDVSWYKDALIILDKDEEYLTKLDIYKEGKIYLQSLSSMIPPLVLDPKEGSQVLDMCAAPGGKTSEIASITNNNVMITAIEKNKIRYDRLKYNLDKQGVKKYTILNIDSNELNEYMKFDYILLDTPCSGSGTYKIDNIKIDDDYLNKLNNTQERLLKKAISMLKKDSILVYSTCSIYKEENEYIINKILNNKDLEIVPIEGFDNIDTLPVSIKGSLCVCPNEYYEGFYVIKIKKAR